MDFIRIPATVLRQKDKELYLFKLSSAILKKITYVTPRSEENPDELQRVYSEPRAKEIGAWIKEENSLLPNAIVVDFKDEVEIEPSADPNIVTISIPDPSNIDNSKIAYILAVSTESKGLSFLMELSSTLLSSQYTMSATTFEVKYSSILIPSK